MTTIELRREAAAIRGPRLGDIIRRISIWRERLRERRALARVACRDLEDAGLSREWADFEANQPFWRPLDRERK